MNPPAAAFFPGVTTPALNEPASLIDAQPADLFFDLKPDTLEQIEARERAGEFTGERLFQRRPDAYREIVAMLAEGTLGVKAIGRRLGVSVNTVRGVRRREAGAVDTQRQKTVQHLADFVELAAGRLADEGEGMPLAQLAVPLGIAVEKMQLLSGGATVRVEIVGVPPIDAFNAVIDAMPRAMGFEVGAAGQKEEAGAGVAAAERDMGSPVLPLVEPESAGDATHRATHDRREDGHPEGGRGSLSKTPPPSETIDCAARRRETKTDSNTPPPTPPPTSP